MSATKTKTIAGAMFDYTVNQTSTSTDLRDDLVKIVNSVKKEAKEHDEDDTFIHKKLKELANEKIGGKTALFMLLSVEAALSISTQEAPEATFTYCALDQFVGIWVLYKVLGNTVDTRDIIWDNFGCNVASACNLSYAMYGAKILEFICALWPETSTEPFGDQIRMQDAIENMDMHKRAEAMGKSVKKMPCYMKDKNTSVIDQIFSLGAIGTTPLSKYNQDKLDKAKGIVLPELEYYMLQANNIKNARDALQGIVWVQWEGVA
jgi:hypothetical protein